MKTPHEFAMELLKPAAAPIPPAQEDEPVAEVVAFGCGVAVNFVGGIGNYPVGTKLFTRPADDKRKTVGASDGCGTRVAEYRTAADDELRKAAEETIKILEFHGEKDYADNLRAALEGK